MAIDDTLINEVKANPPGKGDQPKEYIELLGTPGQALTNLYLVVLNSNSEGGKTGRADIVVDLGSHNLGSNGLLAVLGAGNSYTIPEATSRITKTTQTKMSMPSRSRARKTE